MLDEPVVVGSVDVTSITNCLSFSRALIGIWRSGISGSSVFGSVGGGNNGAKGPMYS